MTRTFGDSSFAANFEPKKAAPLDARTVVNTKAELLLLATWNSGDGNSYTYKGMLVAVINDPTSNNNGVYRLTDADYTSVSSWALIGTWGSIVGNITEQTDLTDRIIALHNDNFTYNEIYKDLTIPTHQQMTVLGELDNSHGFNIDMDGELVVENRDYLLTINNESIGDLADVTLSGVSEGKALRYHTNRFIPWDVTINNLRKKTNSYTLLSDDYSVFFNIGTDKIATLPDATVLINKEYNIINSWASAGTLTVACFSAQTINGSATKDLLTDEKITVQSDGENWIIIK